MEWLWYLDRASGLVSYATLYVAVLSGVFYDTREFGFVTRLSRRFHIRIAVLSTMLFLFHATVGLVDAGLVVTGGVPAPPFPMWYFVASVVVGGEGLLLLVVAVLGFVDARRFERPWTPRIVHALAYGGYTFATIHMFTIGTDLDPTFRRVVMASVALLVVSLVCRLLAEVGVAPFGATDSPS